ncbi:MAG: type IV secretory system conjugative DNA transfer family protein [Lachnospiraceae bacterium]|nr:type IV secretory system conjugative DNA transfer family protein [Lachnospiraceae bacterium]
MMKKADTMILGKDMTYSTDSSKTGVNNNVLVVASSGAGKTMSIIEPRLLHTFNSSVICTMTKQRLVGKYRELYRSRGYNVMELNFVDPLKSNVAYDPLQYICDFPDITFLAESILMSNPRKERSNGDPYWDDMGVSLLSSLIALVLYNKGVNATFTDVLYKVDELKMDADGTLISTSLDDEFKKLGTSRGSRFATTCWNSFRCLPPRTAGCVYSTMNTAIDTLFTPKIRETISYQKKIDFEDVATQKTILFIVSSPVNPALNRYINMFYSQMFKQLFEFAEELPDGRLPIPVTVLCDDFATGSRIQNFPEYISIFREKGISVTLLIQSESQLASMYGSNDCTTIINN